MSKQKHNQSSLSSITLHRLIVTFSYLGSSARLLLIASLALALFAAQMIDAGLTSGDTVAALRSGIQALFYVIGTFFVLDIGYLLIARAYRLSPKFDHIALFASEAILAGLYFIPYLVVVSDAFMVTSTWILVMSLGILSVRLLVGLLYGTSAKK